MNVNFQDISITLTRKSFQHSKSFARKNHYKNMLNQASQLKQDLVRSLLKMLLKQTSQLKQDHHHSYRKKNKLQKLVIKNGISQKMIQLHLSRSLLRFC